MQQSENSAGNAGACACVPVERCGGILVQKVGFGDVHLLRENAKCLSPEERKRGERFRDSTARNAFLATRIALRLFLADVLDCDPGDIRIRYNPHGKPYLEELESSFKFNVSHSDGIGLLAVHPWKDIGVDVERVRLQPDLRRLAMRFFSVKEWEALERLDGDDFVRAFFRCWTRKEAVLKMIGTGLSVDLKAFSVSIGEEARLLESTVEALDGNCVLEDLSVGEDYAACVAFRNT